MQTCIDHQPDFPCPSIVGVLHEFLEDGGTSRIISEDLSNSCREIDL
jgi:hypothetical protein